MPGAEGIRSAAVRFDSVPAIANAIATFEVARADTISSSLAARIRGRPTSCNLQAVQRTGCDGRSMIASHEHADEDLDVVSLFFSPHR